MTVESATAVMVLIVVHVVPENTGANPEIPLADIRNCTSHQPVQAFTGISETL